MTFSFMSDGCALCYTSLVGTEDSDTTHSIPIVYYGQEQGFNGNADPVSTQEPLTLRQRLLSDIDMDSSTVSRYGRLDMATAPATR